MIIGITGTICSGKETVVKYLQQKGFKHYSISDEIRKVIFKRGLKNTREVQRILGNELREKYGAGYFAKRILRRIKGNTIISSVRTLGEVEELRRRNDFYLIAVDADPKIRFNRAKKRGRLGDAKNLTGFLAQEAKEQSKQKTAQSLKACVKSADYLIMNNGTIKELYQKVEQVYAQIKKETIQK